MYNIPAAKGPTNVLYLIAMQCVDDSHKYFPGKSQTIQHHTLAMCGEAGEVANVVKKIDRGSLDINDPAVVAKLGDEIADVFIYLMNIVGNLKIDLYAEYEKKRKFNDERFGDHS